jgi:hypothetical protein
MARTFLSGAALAAGLALATTGLGPVAVADSPFDHVVGGGQNNPPAGSNIAHFQINVKSGPNGEAPKGSFSFKRTDGGPPNESYSATVTCLRVQGNLAFVVGQVTKSKDKPNTPVGDFQFALLKDVGNGPSSDDEIQNGGYTGDPYTCPSPTEPRPEAVTHGNIEISDAS